MAQTKVMPCKCVGLFLIVVKSAGVKNDLKPRVTNIPFNTRNAGAQYQDKKYGVGLRLHNITDKKVNSPMATCTVCGERKGA